MLKKLSMLVVVAMAGCAGMGTPHVILVHPKTGDIRQCKGKSRGWMIPVMGMLPAMAAKATVENCVTQHQALGYKRADELTPAERDKLRPTRGPDFKGEYKIKTR